VISRFWWRYKNESPFSKDWGAGHIAETGLNALMERRRREHDVE
jgi:hypothetical protein